MLLLSFLLSCSDHIINEVQTKEKLLLHQQHWNSDTYYPGQETLTRTVTNSQTEAQQTL